MRKYTLAFIFTRDFSEVLLIHKNRPDWQKGTINGVGGKVEEGESFLDCIKREVFEETGCETQLEDWSAVGEIAGADWEIGVFCYIHAGSKADFFSATDEQIEWFSVRNLPSNVRSNLPWLISFCLDSLASDVGPKKFLVQY